MFHHPYNLESISPALPNLVVALLRKLICPWSYNTKLHDLSEVRVGWHFLVRFISCNNFGFLVLFSSICFKHVNADIAKKQIRYSFVNSKIKVQHSFKSVIKSNAKTSLTTSRHDLHKQSPRDVLWNSVLKNFAKCTGKQLWRSLFIIKL